MDQNLLNRNIPVDLNKYKPKYYAATVTVDTAEGGIGEGAVTFDNVPFILTHATHTILGASFDYTEIPAVIKQDGQYSIDWKDDQTSFQNEPISAESMFGSNRIGEIIPLPVRVAYKGSKTLSVRITNLVDRTATGTTFKVQIVFCGFELWR